MRRWLIHCLGGYTRNERNDYARRSRGDGFHDGTKFIVESIQRGEVVEIKGKRYKVSEVK